MQLTDEQLIEEIRQRFELNQNALNDMRALTRKLEQMNEKLQESEALKSQFLSNIRNEINNPLSAIMGLAAQFFGKKCDPEACKRSARMIYAEAFNLDFQLQNVFMAAELEAGEAELSYALVDLPALVGSCVDKLTYRSTEKELDVEVRVADGLQFTSDAQKLELIVTNLLANAVEFNRVGGKITVEAALAATGALQVQVNDNGPGIAPADQEAIFDRFRQLESGTTKGHRGHGLGLSICWSLAELLGGTLDVDSQPGQGSRFALILPCPDVEVKTRAKDGNFFLFDTADDVEQF